MRQSELAAALNIRICWHHWQAGHGKGEHDGVGALIKRAIRLVAATEGGVVINSADDLFDWCVSCKTAPAAKTSEAHAAAVELAERRFVYVPVDAVEHPNGQRYTGARGQQRSRCFFTAGIAGIVEMRELSCFCASCRWARGWAAQLGAGRGGTAGRVAGTLSTWGRLGLGMQSMRLHSQHFTAPDWAAGRQILGTVSAAPPCPPGSPGSCG
jgi:hypothetical protein